MKQNSQIGVIIIDHLRAYNRMLLDVANAQRYKRDAEIYTDIMKSVNNCIQLVTVFDSAIADLTRTVGDAINER